MAVAAPKRRSSTVTAPAPSRTTTPRRKPARKVPARTAPRVRTAPKPRTRRSTQPKLALVVGRTAAGVRHLPDSGLIVRMTRGRTWIAVLGVLLVGIVALNVVTLSFAASSGKIDEQITTLEEENSAVANRVAERFSQDRVRHEAAAQGLAMSTSAEPSVIQFEPSDVDTAAQRLAGAG